ncbi:hypothetical protein AAG747_24815 [Rapidithrix thailandica]|uniref:Uncharacterized protein n=1 Tax=Rapidithrix thailandica TaxID=413964 RepID=A0AAW9SB75_9BACT
MVSLWLKYVYKQNVRKVIRQRALFFDVVFWATYVFMLLISSQ